MLGIRLYLAQRISALIMAPLVVLHLVLIIYAVQGGVDASEILGRTRGSLLWGVIYGLFVLAVSVHGAIGLRVIVYEWLSWPTARLNLMTWVVGLVLFVLGARAVYAVVLA